MFMNVITGYFSTLKHIQCHMFGSRSCEGQTNQPKCVYHIYHKYAKYKQR